MNNPTPSADAVTVPHWLTGLTIVCLIAFTAESAQLISFSGFLFEGAWQGLHIIAAARILEGLPLYPDPVQGASYYVYAPALPWIHAGFLALMGKSILTMKVSALFFCAATLMGIAVLSRLLGANRRACLVAVGFYVAFYQIIQFWHLSVRPDSPATALVIWATITGVIATRTSHVIWPLVTGLLFALAALCKQTYGLMGLAFFTYLLVQSEKRVLIVAMSVWVITGLIVTLLYSRGDEHFIQSMLILGEHQRNSLGSTLLLSRFLLFFLAIPLGLAILQREKLGALPFMIAGAAAMGLVGVSKWGGNINAFQCLIALCSPVIAYQLSQPDKLIRSLVSLGSALFVAMFIIGSSQRILAYDPAQAGNVDRVADFIDRHRDQVLYFPKHNYLTYLYADQYHHCDWMSENLIKADKQPPRELLENLVNRKYDLILGEFSTEGLNEFRTNFYHAAGLTSAVGIEIYQANAHLTAPEKPSAD